MQTQAGIGLIREGGLSSREKPVRHVDLASGAAEV